MTCAPLVLWLLSQAAGAAAPLAEAESPPRPASAMGGWRYLTRLEATGLALLPGGGVGGVESYAQVRPMLVVAEGEAFGLTLGAPVRLRLAGGEVGAGLVRREDWDSGQPGARHLDSGQVRWRFGHKLYALAEGGMLLFPEEDGALRPGAFALLGVGVDNAR